MASKNGSDGLKLFLLLAVLASGASAQTWITLEQASSRKPPNYSPAYEGQLVNVHGVVAYRPILVREYCHTVIQDESGHGLTLDSPESVLAGVRPGDRVQVQGVIFNRSGLPVLQPSSIRKVGMTNPPLPAKATIAELNTFKRLGTLVEVEGVIVSHGENAGGEMLLLGNPQENPLNVFLPVPDEHQRGTVLHFGIGDKVRIIGIASQYCPRPPYNRLFQVIVAGSDSITLIEHGWVVSPSAAGIVLAGLALALGLWWSRERDMRIQRERLRAINSVAEEVLSAGTPGEIARKVCLVLCKNLEAADINLYLVNKDRSALDRVPNQIEPQPLSVRIDSPIGPLSSAVALCYRNKSLLHIPNTRRSPVIDPDDEKSARSVLLMPMYAQQELLGIMVVKYVKRVRRINVDDLCAIQHLANQIGASLKFQEQASMREQLLRSEKMAAAGQLITGVANELQGPLSAIHALANDLVAQHPGGTAETGLREIAFEAHRGADIVSRLVSFSRAEQVEAKPLDVTAVIDRLIEFRERERTAKGVQIHNGLPRQALMVMGDRSQLEQVFLNLLVHAEQSLAEASEKSIAVTGREAGKYISVVIDYTDRTPGNHADPFEIGNNGDALGLQVCQGIVQSHGGEIRLTRNLPGGARFEIELPLLEEAPEQRVNYIKPARPLTVLMVEPDKDARRKLLAVLSERGHRAVPIQSAEEAVDMAHRLRFDIVFSAVRLPSMNWVEFFEKIRREIGAFVLVTEGYDADLSRAFKGSEGYLLSKPIDDADAQRLLATIESRQETVEQWPAG